MSKPMQTTTTNPLVVLGRGLLRRCPNCGNPAIFTSWFNLAPACDRCGLDFDREPGWWIGGMIVNTGVSLTVLAAVIVGGLLIYWPNIPVLGLTIAAMAAMAVVPTVFYPMSKTIWLGIDLLMTGMDRRVRE